MLESVLQFFASLQQNIALPNLHPAVVHFPIALLLTAFLFDLACLAVRSYPWMDRAATALYLLGTLGLGGAYLTGTLAEDGLGEISAKAEITLAEHEDLALITLIAFAVFTALRFLVSWLARRDRFLGVGFFRLLALLAAPCALIMLVLTADHGGALVYRHGVSVGVEETLEE